MNILLVSATYLEIEPLLLQFQLEQEVNQKLKRYTYNKHKIDVLIPGVGMTCTAYWMGKTLNSKIYDVAINLGIAGSFNENIKIGETVNIISDQISEIGAEDGDSFLSTTDLGFTEEELPLKLLQDNSIINSLTKVSAITVNTTHGNDTSIQKIKERFNPQVESMEGAAFFYACLLEEITCAQIRTISNKVERRNKDNWDIPLAVKNLCDTGLKIIQTL
ncbi:MAG: futalosine hydrolase [Flavobacteriales bacterium]|nr:futalosine hydrolase [Flavobacteriales bacterium]